MDHGENRRGFFESRVNIALVGFLAIAGFFLIAEHWAHVLGYWPWLLLLACPLLHIFMHGGQGDTGDADSRDRQPPEPHRH